MRLGNSVALVMLARLLAGAAPALAQPSAQPTLDPRWVAERWSRETGLPVNGVTHVIQARSGYLWLTTFDGIVRFDGVRFTVYGTGTDQTLPTSRYVLATEAPDGSIWVQSEYGHLVRHHHGRFERIGPDEGLEGRVVWRVMPVDDSTMAVATELALHVLVHGRLQERIRFGADIVPVPSYWLGRMLERAADGSFWVAGGEARLLHMRRGGRMDDVRPGLPLATGQPLAILARRDSSLLIGAGEGLFVLRSDRSVQSIDPNRLVYRLGRGAVTGRIYYLARDGIHQVNGSRVAPVIPLRDSVTTNLVEDDEGGLWFATGRTVWRDSVRVLELDGLSKNLVRDREGSIWIANESGLFRIKTARVVTVAPDDTEHRSVYPVLETADGSIWMGLLRGGLARWRNGVFTRYTDRDGLHTNMVSALYQDIDGTLWVAPWTGACRFRPPRCALPANADREFAVALIRAIHRDRQGVLWFGAEGALWRLSGEELERLTRADGLPHDWIRVITEARDGTLWFGTNGGGIFAWRDGRYEAIDTAQGLSGQLVRAIHEDERGVLWVGTEGRGLNRIVRDPAAPGGWRITVYRQQDGLFDDGVHQILEDGLGRLWMSSNRGISWVPRADLEAFAEGRLPHIQAIGYQERDGMRNREANGGVNRAGMVASDGRLWFPTVDGVAIIDPRAVQSNHLPPPVVVEGVTARGEEVSVDGPLRLRAGQREFEVEYTALSLLAPEHMRFRYRLEPFHDDWVEAGTRRTAFFTNVPPGRYTFHVIATNNDGVWNEDGATLDLSIAPWFYETRAFKAATLLALAGVLGLAVQVRTARHRKRQADLARLVEERTADAERHARRAEDALAVVGSQAERLQRLDAAKSRFFANVSHEFRTPLTLTIGPLEDLRAGLHGPLDEGAAQEVGLALRNARRLLKLVNELLDITRLEAGEMRLHAAPGDIGGLVEQVGQAFLPLAERRGVDLRIAREPSLPAVWFEATLVERIIGNLLSNALKFTPPGGSVRLRISPLDAPEAGRSVQIEVRDSGRGIPEGELAHIFERFHQVNEAADRLLVGTGIGLSLTRELVELHRGRITVESAEGFGTTFRVLLRAGTAHLRPEEIVAVPPAAPAPTPLPGLQAPSGADPVDAPADDHAEDRPTVLVVDDHPEVRAYVRKHLASSYRVLEAGDGDAALAAVRAHEPDLVLCDVMMPGRTGIEVLQELRGHPETDFIPVILLTAQATSDRRVEGLASGADDYLTKPFAMEELLARVGNLIASRERLRARFRTVGLPAPPRPDEDPLLTRLRATVLEHLTDDAFGVEQLAQELAMSRSHLYRRVHQLTSATVTDLLRTIRLERAWTLLQAGAGNVSEVAYAVGFKSLSHFSRSFREMFGSSPSAVRQAAGTGET